MKQNIQPDWLSGIASPISAAAPCGEDPRYLDSFVTIKEEIEKLSGTDYEIVSSVSRELLTKTTKDLRVAAFLLLAATYLEGWQGLYHGLYAYRMLLEEFWKCCHPLKENQRHAALLLLNNPRLSSFAENSSDSPELLGSIYQEITRINEFLVDAYGPEAPRLVELAHWFGKKSKEQDNSQAETYSAEQPKPKSATAQPGLPAIESVAVLCSEREFDLESRKLHRYLCDKGDVYRAIALSRALHWHTNALPAHDQGLTRVPAPRTSGWAELNNQIAAGNSLETLLCCEKLFLEAAFRYALKLQHIAWQQAKTGRQTQVAELIETLVSHWCQTVPDILCLQFADGSPFCDTETRMWIDSLLQPVNHTAADDPTGNSFDQTLQNLLAEASSLASEKKLSQSLLHMRTLNCRSETERLQLRLSEARLCLIAGRPQLAEATLENLHNLAKEQQIGIWHPELACEIIQLRCKALQSINSSGKEEKALIALRIQQLHSEACLVDLALAADLTQ